MTICLYLKKGLKIELNITEIKIEVLFLENN